jgi:hypothetical protein
MFIQKTLSAIIAAMVIITTMPFEFQRKPASDIIAAVTKHMPIRAKHKISFRKCRRTYLVRAKIENVL